HALCTWLGEPISIRESVAAMFRRQSSSNLLIVGKDDEAALGIMAVAMVGLAAQVPLRHGRPQFYVLDFGLADAPYANLLPQLANVLSDRVSVTGRRGLPRVVADLADEVDRRLA